VRVAAAVPARVRNGSRVRVVRVANGSRVRVLLVMIVARAKSGSHVKVALVRVAQVAVRVVNGSHVRVLVVMIAAQVVARVRNGSRVRVLVVMIAAQVVVHVKSGSRAKVALVRVARVVNGSHVRALVVMTAGRVVRVAQVVDRVAMTVVMTVAKTCRKPRRSVVAPKCLPAKALVSTARISRLVTAQIEKSRSSTKVRCVAASSTLIVARLATRHAVALAPSRALSVAMTARCFPLRQLCKSHWPAKCAVQLETVATTR
jgi:hypothetical protein